MTGNLPPGVTPADIDKHFGPPDHDHEFREPESTEADETMTIMQRCTHHHPRGGRCDVRQLTYYRPDRMEVIHDGDLLMSIPFPDGFDHTTWADDVLFTVEDDVNHSGPDPIGFDPEQEEIGLWTGECPMDCTSEHRIVYKKCDKEVVY